ncbi:MAG TPA: hypothetical protein VFL83_21640 [Anaeromyxobacter sp.]|nr:hypothetical protein [Anaeromyxobacter sp.]
MFGWWKRKRSPPSSSPRDAQAVREPSAGELEDVCEGCEELRRRVNGLRYDLDELVERFQRRAGRENRATSRSAPADGAGAAPTRRNGLPSIAELRAAGKLPGAWR